MFNILNITPLLLTLQKNLFVLHGLCVYIRVFAALKTLHLAIGPLPKVRAALRLLQNRDPAVPPYCVLDQCLLRSGTPKLNK